MTTERMDELILEITENDVIFDQFEKDLFREQEYIPTVIIAFQEVLLSFVVKEKFDECCRLNFIKIFLTAGYYLKCKELEESQDDN